MQKRQIAFNFKGIAQDAINGVVNSQFAYKITNMRISASKNSNALLLTTEKGTSYLRISQESDLFVEDSNYLGHCVVKDYVIIFVISETGDYIYRLDFSAQSEEYDCTNKIIFHGNLGFDVNHRIESIGIYENENVQKVYWIDGINQPRIINIVDDNLPIYNPTSEVYTKFDFLMPAIDHDTNNTINVTKTNGGLFNSGVIQYCYSLYNLNNQETSILDISPLNYITIDDHGVEQDKQVNCSFIINIHCNIVGFDYLRLYSIQRNSLNGQPLVRVVLDIKLTDSDITVIDDGLGGYDIEPSIIKYILLPLYPNCITYKDNTLFLGNYSTDDILNKTKLYMYQDTLDTESILRDTGIYAYTQDDEGFYIYHSQLNNNSRQIKSFKYLEWYKLGVQFLDKYGNWSQPYFIKDALIEHCPSIKNDGEYQLPCFGIEINEIYNLLSTEEKERYIKIRPVVSFPEISERSILCQGILNPTVFNITDRMSKTCYALSSWFFRPYLPSGYTHDSNNTYDSQYYGAVINYNHYDTLNSSMDIGGEIQGMYFDEDVDYTSGGGLYFPAHRPYLSIEDQDYNPLNYKNFYYIDQSIATLNSPDIEFDTSLKTMDLNGYQMRIVGIIPFDNTVGKYNIISQNPQFFNDKYSYRRNILGLSVDEMYIRGSKLPQGFYDYPLVVNYGIATNGKGILCALNCWFDDISDLTKWQDKTYWSNDPNYGEEGLWNHRDRQVSYYVYPWNRQYLNNYNHGNDLLRNNINSEHFGYFEDSESAKIKTKILSNLRFSINTKFFDYGHESTVSTHKMLYNNNQIQKLSDSKLYYGYDNKYRQYNSEYNGRSLEINVGGVVSANIKHDDVQGYPITVENNSFSPEDNSDNLDFENRIKNSVPREFFDHDVGPTTESVYYLSSNNRSADPILISYKSSPHIVIDLSEEFGKRNVIPALERQITGSLQNNKYIHNFEQGWFLPWHDSGYDDRTNGYQLILLTNTGINNNKAYLLMAEIYRDNTNNSYFNIWDSTELKLSNESNLYNRIWVPCGNSKDFHEDVDSTHRYLYWTEGDTYYQRYDCVKTKPYSENEYQSIVEIGSFMVETHINLDGRYDTNRGMIDNTIVSDNNFNLLNSVYNQKNNFYNYNILDELKSNLNKFDTSVIWSSNKTYGESIDTWTKISPVNKLDLDGNKGTLNALRKFRNNIYAFQNSSVSRIRFNDRTALSTVEGLPIQLASADKVDGYEFINEIIGCQNKFSNVETENGIYFIDNNTPGIYKLGYNEYGNINIDNISKQKLMQRWFENNNDRNALSFYDKNINEVLFNINKQSLVFSLDSGYFSQFINYESVKDIISINNHSIAPIIDKYGSVSLHKLREGYYSRFFDKYKDYGIEFIGCPVVSNDTNGIIRDCIYDNVWYRSDVFNKGNDEFDNDAINKNYISDETFDKISVIDTYQNNDSDLLFDLTEGQKITTLRKKFMMWYARIPRHKYNMQNKNYDRMRDRFIKISLKKHQVNNHKMVLGDIAIDCFY